MEYKNLLVSIHAFDRYRQQTSFAIRLAKKHKAHLFGNYVSPTVGESPAEPAISIDKDPKRRSGAAGQPVNAAALAEVIHAQFEMDLRRTAWRETGC